MEMSPRILNGKAITKMQAAVIAIIIIVAIIAGIAYYSLMGPAATPTPATPTPKTPPPATPTPATPTPATPTPATPTPATPTPATPTPLPLKGQILKLGVVAPLSGAAAPYGAQGKRGIEMAIDEINTAGGILGAYIQLIVEDCANDPKIAVSATEKLITVDKCQVIRGVYSSSVILAMMEITEKYEIPLLTVGASAMEITAKGYKYIFRMAPNSTDFATTAQLFLSDTIRPQRIAILYAATSTGEWHRKELLRIADEMKFGWNFVVIEPYQPGTLEFKSTLEKIRANEAQVLILTGVLTDIARIAAQMEEMDWHPIVICQGSTELLEWLDLVGIAGKGFFCTQEFWCDRQYPNATALHEAALKYWHSYGKPLDFMAYSAYLGMYVLKATVESAKSLEPKKLRDALAKTEFNIPWYGLLKFYPNGHMAAICTIAQVQDARTDEPWQAHGITFHTVWPSPYNSSMPIIP